MSSAIKQFGADLVGSFAGWVPGSAVGAKVGGLVGEPGVGWFLGGLAGSFIVCSKFDQMQRDGFEHHKKAGSGLGRALTDVAGVVGGGDMAFLAGMLVRRAPMGLVLGAVGAAAVGGALLADDVYRHAHEGPSEKD
jgi:hypothetical protein